MYTKKIHFMVEEETLVGDIIVPNKSSKPHLLFIHGAGRAGKERTRYLAFPLAENSIGSFGFDLSGHGESTGKLEESSLQKRVREAHCALNFLATEEPVVICASSMGGHIALELLKTERVRTLVLFCPAVYAREAFDKPFNKGFTQIIRKEDSWKQTDVFSVLEQFTGNLLIFSGEKDDIIPIDVIKFLDQHSKSVNKKEVIFLPGAPHQIHTWISERPELTESIIKKILEFSIDQM